MSIGMNHGAQYDHPIPVEGRIPEPERFDVTEFLSVVSPPWKAEAACTPDQADLFFPERGEDADEAKRICAGCTVRRECLIYALANNERHGIWGGTSRRERRKLTVAAITNKPLPPVRYFTDVIVARRARPLPPINHGTYGGHQAHRRRGEEACDACKAAGAAYWQNRKAMSVPAEITHGTTAGYRAHLRRCEIACDPCREAMRADRRAEYRAKRDGIAATVVEIGPRRKTGRILEGANA